MGLKKTGDDKRTERQININYPILRTEKDVLKVERTEPQGPVEHYQKV